MSNKYTEDDVKRILKTRMTDEESERDDSRLVKGAGVGLPIPDPRLVDKMQDIFVDVDAPTADLIKPEEEPIWNSYGYEEGLNPVSNKGIDKMPVELIDMVIGELQTMCYNGSRAKGFWDAFEFVKHHEALSKGRKRELLDAIIAQKMALAHSEISEALEGFRESKKMSEKIPDFTSIEEEIADTIIRILDLACILNSRTGEAIMAKLKYNRGRLYQHGKAF